VLLFPKFLAARQLAPRNGGRTKQLIHEHRSRGSKLPIPLLILRNLYTPNNNAPPVFFYHMQLKKDTGVFLYFFKPVKSYPASAARLPEKGLCGEEKSTHVLMPLAYRHISIVSM